MLQLAHDWRKAACLQGFSGSQRLAQPVSPVLLVHFPIPYSKSGEAAINQATKQPENVNGAPGQSAGRQPPRFGAGVDPVEAGRKGGRASGIARRLKPLRELEAGIVESRNGAAKAKLLELKHREMADLARERRRADEIVMRLMDEADREREEIELLGEQKAGVRAEMNRLITARTALYRREKMLRESIAASEGELVDRLRSLHEDGGLEPALVELDLFDVVDDEDGDAVPSAA
jgi:hypothetical protein